MGGRRQGDGPKPRDYAYDVPKKVRKAALRSALALRCRDEQVLIVEKWQPDAPKTKARREGPRRSSARRRCSSSTRAANVALAKSVRNLARLELPAAEGLNVYDILKHDVLVLTAATAKQLEASLS